MIYSIASARAAVVRVPELTNAVVGGLVVVHSAASGDSRRGVRAQGLGHGLGDCRVCMHKENYTRIHKIDIYIYVYIYIYLYKY